jgi:hypothetical protein
LPVLSFDAEGRNLDPLDGLQHLHLPIAIRKGAHGVFPVDGALQLFGSGDRVVCSSFPPARTHCLAAQLSAFSHREDVSVGLRHN